MLWFFTGNVPTKPLVNLGKDFKELESKMRKRAQDIKPNDIMMSGERVVSVTEIEGVIQLRLINDKRQTIRSTIHTKNGTLFLRDVKPCEPTT